jgi:GT2 family glycosyltransferase
MDRPALLKRCLMSILEGDAVPAEVAIVDQSRDERTAGISQFPQWNASVTVHHVRQRPRGLAAARNAAVACTSSPIVVFTDDDCVVNPHWLSTVLRTFEGPTRPDAVTGRVLPLGKEQSGLYPVSTRPSVRATVHRGRSLPWAVGTGGNAAVRRQWFQRVGGFDERLGTGSPGRSAEDLDLFYRLLRAGATIHYDPDAIVYHQQQALEGRLARAVPYAFGMSACCARWAREADPYVLWIVARWLVDRVDSVGRAIVRRQGWRLKEEWLTITGAASGIGYGLTLNVEPRVQTQAYAAETD